VSEKSDREIRALAEAAERLAGEPMAEAEARQNLRDALVELAGLEDATMEARQAAAAKWAGVPMNRIEPLLLALAEEEQAAVARVRAEEAEVRGRLTPDEVKAEVRRILTEPQPAHDRLATGQAGVAAAPVVASGPLRERAGLTDLPAAGIVRIGPLDYVAAAGGLQAVQNEVRAFRAALDAEPALRTEEAAAASGRGPQ
jgi:hypothetical protein